MEVMICEKCREQGLKSVVIHEGGRSTLMHYSPFYNEEGAYHHHDHNTVTESWKCSNGHRFIKKSKPRCPCDTCDWNIKRRLEMVVTWA